MRLWSKSHISGLFHQFLIRMNFNTLFMRTNLSLKSFYLTIIIILLIGCSEYEAIVHNYNYYYEGDKLVVHGFISTQDGIHVWINKTRSPLDTTQIPIDIQIKSVYLLVDDIPLVELERIDNNYFSYNTDIVIFENTKYSIKVNVNGYDEIYSSNQIVPKTPLIDSIKYVKNNQLDDYIDFWFTDSDTFQNFFSYNYSLFYSGEEYIPKNQDINNAPLLSDISFSGSQKHNRIDGNFYSINGLPDSIHVNLYSLSEDYYNFLISLRQNAININDIFYRPIPIKSNMSNGYGVFGANSYSTNTIIIE